MGATRARRWSRMRITGMWLLAGSSSPWHWAAWG